MYPFIAWTTLTLNKIDVNVFECYRFRLSKFSLMYRGNKTFLFTCLMENVWLYSSAIISARSVIHSGSAWNCNSWKVIPTYTLKKYTRTIKINADEANVAVITKQLRTNGYLRIIWKMIYDPGDKRAHCLNKSVTSVYIFFIIL